MSDQTIQVQIDSQAPGGGVRITKYIPDVVMTQSYVVGGDFAPGFADWVTTNTTDPDATQAAVILAKAAGGGE
jgi:hypothetical protein